MAQITMILSFIALSLVLNSILKQSLREEEIDVPEGRNIVSPADGKIINIIDVSNKENIKIKKGVLGLIDTNTKGMDDSYLISIFMNPFDNHVNRAPIKGKVLSVEHHKGKFRRANNLRALENERSEIIMDSNIGKLKIMQIAGYVFRRIETSVKAGQTINKGNKIGLIRCGSQVSLIVPKKINLKIKKGDKVKAGSSIIGEI